MTIKEFATLCACNTQTLRYYDKIDLLKPVQVDPWSGYRYYDAKQAIDFVKIKNLQAADFTIEEIKKLLTQPDQLVYEAFDAKIAEQTQKLERIREIQKTYLAEKTTMEKIIYSMTDYMLSQCSRPDVLPEFGLKTEDAPAILALLREYLNDSSHHDLSSEEVSLTVNEEVVHGQEAVLERIHSLGKENLGDTIQLHTGFGHSMEHTTDPDPDFSGYETLYECVDWAHVYDFIDSIPRLEPGNIYCLWLRTNDSTYFDDFSFSLFLMGAVLYKQKLQQVSINCATSSGADKRNHFKLLRKK